MQPVPFVPSNGRPGLSGASAGSEMHESGSRSCCAALIRSRDRRPALVGLAAGRRATPRQRWPRVRTSARDVPAGVHRPARRGVSHPADWAVGSVGWGSPARWSWRKVLSVSCRRCSGEARRLHSGSGRPGTVAPRADHSSASCVYRGVLWSGVSPGVWPRACAGREGLRRVCSGRRASALRLPLPACAPWLEFVQ